MAWHKEAGNGTNSIRWSLIMNLKRLYGKVSAVLAVVIRSFAPTSREGRLDSMSDMTYIDSDETD